MATKTKGKGKGVPGQRRASQSEGALAAVTKDGIVGWAWNPAQPMTPLAVSIMAGSVRIASGSADNYDPDLYALHGKKGVPGFVLQLDTIPEGPYPLKLTLHDAQGAPLGAPLVIKDAAPLARLVRMRTDSKFQGCLDGIRNGVLRGWVWDPSRPHVQVALELLDGTARLASAEASEYRADLKQAGIGDGRHAFAIHLPDSLLDGQTHSLSVRIKGTSFFLSERPILFGPLEATPLQEQVVALRKEVERLSALVQLIVAPDGQIQRGIISTLAERVAALSEIQRELVERELDALRKVAFEMPSVRSRRPSQTRTA